MKRILTTIFAVVLLSGISLLAQTTPDYLCFTAKEDGSSVKLSKNGSPTSVTLETSSNGLDWTDYTFNTDIPLAKAGDKVYFRNTSGEVTEFSRGNFVDGHTALEGCYSFNMSGSIAASGNIMSLVDKSCSTAEIPNEGCFYYLFLYCTSLTEAPALPATTLKEFCYTNMFSGCSSLTKAPELPATTLVEGCYFNMFGAWWDTSEGKVIYCSKLNYVKVGFTDWNTAEYATFDDWGNGWLNGVSETGTFVCPIDLEQKRGSEFIPVGWTDKYPVKAHLDEETGTHYATFYSGTKAYKLENATAYAGGELDSSVGDGIVLALMPLTRVGDVIPADVPVVLKSSQSEILISETSESGTVPATNSLTGTDSEIAAAGEGISALSLGQSGIGFYPWAGKSIGAHRAYYKTPALR